MEFLKTCCTFTYYSQRMGTITALWLMLIECIYEMMARSVGSEDAPDTEKSYTIDIVVFLLLIVIFVSGFYAVHKKEFRFLWPFFVFLVVHCIITMPLIIIEIISGIGKFEIFKIGSLLFGGIFLTVVEWHFACVVKSYMLEEESKSTPQNIV